MVQPPALSFIGTLTDAYRRACRNGSPEVRSDLVLYYARRRVRVLQDRLPRGSDKAWREALASTGTPDPEPPAATALYPSFDADVAAWAEAAMREAAASGSDVLRWSRHRGHPVSALPVFSPAVRFAVYEAIHETERRGIGHATAAHLALGLLAVPGGAAARLATRLLEERWVPGHKLAGALRADPAYHHSGAPSHATVNQLIVCRVLPVQAPRLLRLPWRIAAQVFVGRYLRRPYRRHGARYGHPVLFVLEANATRQAVWAGKPHVTAVDVLLSILDLDEQLASTGRALPQDVAQWNQAGEILTGHGLTRQVVARIATQLEAEPADDEQNHSAVPTRGWWPTRVQTVGLPDPGRTALLAFREASLSARRQGHPYAGTTHLLAALLTDPNGPATRLLRRLDTDPETIRSQALRRLESASASDFQQ